MKLDKLEEIKLRAKKIAGNSNLNIMSDEKELLEQLMGLLQANAEKADISLLEKTLDNIEIYIKTKEKMFIAKEDYEYLVEISKELKKQSIRRLDGILYVSIFKVIEKDKGEQCFLIREHAEKYKKVYENNFRNKIVKVEETNNSDLIKLLEIIKRNF